MKTGSWHW